MTKMEIPIALAAILLLMWLHLNHKNSRRDVIKVKG